MSFDEYWIVPDIGKVTLLPHVQISNELPIPTRWSDGEDIAKTNGALFCRDERLPEYYSHPEDGTAYVEETEDGVRSRTLDTSLLVYDAAAHYSAVKKAKQDDIVDSADALLQSVGSEYSESERAGWDQQFDEAQRYQNDNSADVPMLKGIATARGVTVAYLVERVIEKRDEWVAAYTAVIGARQAYQDTLDTAVATYKAAEDDDAKAEAIATIQDIEVSYSITETEESEE